MTVPCRRVIVFLAMAALAISASLVMTNKQAAAHYSYLYHGSDFASLDEDHLTMTACDRERDGNSVYARALLSDGRYFIVDDGGDSGCDTGGYTGIVKYQLCEKGKSCTAYRSA